MLKKFGRLDALINNAGLADPADPPVDRLPLQAWHRRIGVNLTGVFLMTKHCAPHLRRSRGAIVWIARTRLSRRQHRQHPAGRAGRPEDIGEFVAFLLFCGPAWQ